MPIVNGTYVYDTLPGVKKGQWQQQAFGEVGSTADWSDAKTAAYNYLLKQQEQAYNLDLWHLQNEYNSPAAQMKRYQDAGLNPNLIYQQQNLASSPAAASATSYRPGNLRAKQAQNALSAIGQMMNIVKSARDTYDYMTYGRQAAYWNNIRTQEQALGMKLQNEWDDYLLHGENMIYGDTTRVVNGPRANMYRYQMDTQKQRYEQLKAVVSTIPDQNARTKALTALDQYRLQILEGQYGAVMNIHTGSQGLDAFLKMLGFYLLGH